MAGPNPLGEAIVAAARAEFENRRRSFIDIPEWIVDGPDGKKVPTRIWYDPIPMEEYFELFNWRKESGTQYGMVHVVVMKALDEQGNRLFNAEHELMLLKLVDAEPVMRIANAITGRRSVAEAEKN